MKYKVNIKSLLFLSTLFLFAFCSGVKNYYQSECVAVDTDGYVTVKIWNTNSTKSVDNNTLRKEALKSILYSGITGTNSCKKQPPILNTLEEQDRFKSIEKSFFSESGKWMVFTRFANSESNSEKTNAISISRDQLRKYLEDLNIIKSLKQGF